MSHGWKWACGLGEFWAGRALWVRPAVDPRKRVAERTGRCRTSLRCRTAVAVQDRRVRLYDVERGWRLRKDITTRMCRYTGGGEGGHGCQSSNEGMLGHPRTYSRLLARCSPRWKAPAAHNLSHPGSCHLFQVDHHQHQCVPLIVIIIIIT